MTTNKLFEQHRTLAGTVKRCCEEAEWHLATAISLLKKRTDFSQRECEELVNDIFDDESVNHLM